MSPPIIGQNRLLIARESGAFLRLRRAATQRRAKSHNSRVFSSNKSHPKQRENPVRPQIPTGMLQPTFISPARAGVAVNDGFRSFPGSEGQAGVFRHLSEIASVRSTK